VKPVNRIEIRSDPRHPRSDDDDGHVDIRIYISRRAIALIIAVMVVISRLIEVSAAPVIDRLLH
jgi:hypothetical protein